MKLSRLMPRLALTVFTAVSMFKRNIKRKEMMEAKGMESWNKYGKCEFKKRGESRLCGNAVSALRKMKMIKKL